MAKNFEKLIFGVLHEKHAVQRGIWVSPTVASPYYNCCTDGSTSPGNYGYPLVYRDSAHATSIACT
jgi:hypothetical protein